MSPRPGNRLRRRQRRVRLIAVVTAVAMVVATVAIGVGALVSSLTSEDTTADYPGPGVGVATVVVEPGDSAAAIAASLAAADVVLTEGAFIDAATADARSRGIVPGTYRLKRQMAAADALALMLDPSSRQDVVTVPEGTRLQATLELIAESTRLQLGELERAAADVGSLGLPAWASEATSPEGFLYPAQYDVAPGADATTFLRSMVARFREVAAELDLAARARSAGRDPYDVVIAASLVQAEVSPSDFGKAARAIDNRLEIGMPLQIDSTVNYALERSTVDVTIADTQVDSPYNTYRVEGLTPTPINSPSGGALAAVLDPVPGDWLYWVTTDIESGLTKFATTYDEFLRYKAEFDASRR